MPSVPTYNTPQVQHAGFGDTQMRGNATAETFGGGQSLERVTTAAQGLLGEVQKIQLEEKKKVDDISTQDALARLTKARNQLFWDPKTGAMNRKGKDAFGVVNEYEKMFDDEADAIEKGLTNEDQKRRFRELRAGQKSELNGALTRHTFQEAQRYDEETTNSGLATAREDAIFNYKSQGKIAESLASQEQMIRAHAERTGKPPEWVDQNLSEAKSKTLTSVVSRMLANGEDQLASAYFARNKKLFTGSDAAQLEKELETGSLRGESQRVTDKIIQEYSDLGAAREAVREIKDPKLRDEVDQRVRMEFSIRDQQTTQARERTFMDATQVLEKYKSIDSIPPKQWNALLPSQKNALRSLEKQLLDPSEVVHDDKVYLRYLGMPEGQLARVSEAELIEKVRPYVGEQYYKEIAHRWGRVKEAMGGGPKSSKASAEAKSIFSDKEMILNSLKSAKVFGLKDSDTMSDIGKTDSKAKAYREFAELVDTKFQAHFHDTGKMPSDEQKKKIIDDMLLKKVFVNDGWFSDSEKPVSMLTEDDRGRAYMPLTKIPPNDLTSMRNVLKSKNKRITNNKLERAYAAYLMGDRALFNSILEEN